VIIKNKIAADDRQDPAGVEAPGCQGREAGRSGWGTQLARVWTRWDVRIRTWGQVLTGEDRLLVGAGRGAADRARTRHVDRACRSAGLAVRVAARQAPRPEPGAVIMTDHRTRRLLLWVDEAQRPGNHAKRTGQSRYGVLTCATRLAQFNTDSDGGPSTDPVGRFAGLAFQVGVPRR